MTKIWKCNICQTRHPTEDEKFQCEHLGWNGSSFTPRELFLLRKAWYSSQNDIEGVEDQFLDGVISEKEMSEMITVFLKIGFHVRTMQEWYELDDNEN